MSAITRLATSFVGSADQQKELVAVLIVSDETKKTGKSSLAHHVIKSLRESSRIITSDIEIDAIFKVNFHQKKLGLKSLSFSRLSCLASAPKTVTRVSCKMCSSVSPQTSKISPRGGFSTFSSLFALSSPQRYLSSEHKKLLVSMLSKGIQLGLSAAPQHVHFFSCLLPYVSRCGTGEAKTMFGYFFQCRGLF